MALGVDDAALALIASGLVSTAGALYTNRQNLKYQNNVNDTNWQIAAQNNATQIDLANTAHQREVADLRAAGLNPILSAGGSGASTPSLQQARMDSAQIENPVAGLASSARGLARYMGESYRAQLEATQLDNSIRKSEAHSASWQASTAKRQADLDNLNLQLESEALRDLTTHMVKKSDGSWEREFNPNSEYFQKYKSGMLSDAIVRSRQSARNLYSDVLSGIHTANDVFNTVVGFKRGGALLDLKRHAATRQRFRRTTNYDRNQRATGYTTVEEF